MGKSSQEERDAVRRTGQYGHNVGMPTNRLGRRGRMRVLCFGLAVLLWFGLVVVRLWDLQVLQGGRLSEKAVRQQEAQVDIPARRGGILDREGAELALSTPVQSIGVFADRVEDREALAALLAEVLQVDEVALLAKLRRGGFQWVKRLVDLPATERVRRLGLDVLHFETESKRYYPHGTVGAQVLGTVGIDHVGLAGLEQHFDPQLRGRPGLGVLYYDARQRRYGRKVLRPSVPGSDLLLHLDLQLQSLAHLELERAVRETRSQAGAIVVMQPNTGKIVAMSSWPRFDPNKLSRTRRELENLRNFALSYMVEPGSTFKALTAAAALEEGLVSIEDVFDCEMGGIWIDRRRIRDHHPFGLLTMPQVLMKSSNVGIIKIGYRLGSERLHHYIRRFGFGRQTGIALPAEQHGLVRPLSNWSGSSLASLSMGQEIGVTALQMARFFAAIANGGTLVQPRIVRALREHGHPEVEVGQAPGVRVISAETAATMQAILEQVVEAGTGRLAQIPGYRVAGKTGTAQMINPKTRSYVGGAYLASFCGFAPVNDPALVAVAMLYDPRGQFYYGGRIAAPLFSAIMRRSLRHLDVPPSETFPQDVAPAPQIPEIVLADFVQDQRDMSVEASMRVAQAEFEERRLPTPQPAAKQTRRTLVLAVEPKDSDTIDASEAARVLVRMAPDMRGLTMREAFALAVQMGIDIELEGSGLVHRQSPAPLAALRPGQVLRLQFALVPPQSVETGPAVKRGGG